ncbi:MAG: DUF554 domain-containing protein [Oscillospiraceae bacterium]
MRGIGTICNVLAVIVGSGIGLMLKNGLSARLQSILTQGASLAIIFIGISGAVSGMLSVSDGTFGTHGTTMLVLSLIIGGLIGEGFNIEQKMNMFGEKLRQSFSAKSDSGFTDGFVTASLFVCTGAMAVVGSINDGLTGNYAMLLAKSLLDMIVVMVFASTMGLGVMFAAIPMGIYQGVITLSAVALYPFMSDALVTNIGFVGSVLIFAVGVNMLRPKTFRAGNLLPALLVPVAYEIGTRLFGAA